MNCQILTGDCREVLKTLPDASVQCCVTSPPYFGLRDYGVAGQIGLELSPAEYVEEMVAVFREVRRVLRPDGTLWMNLGDSYANDGKWGGHTGGKHAKALHCSPIGRNKRYTGLKPKDLMGMPWEVAFALREDGWFLRRDIIWHKLNPMPESVTDRPTTAHEYLFLLTKSQSYYYDAEAIKEPASENTHDRTRKDRAAAGQKCEPTPKVNGLRPRKLADAGSGVKNNGSFDAAMAVMPATRNKRSVWSVTSDPYPEAHFATYPPALIKPCIMAGSRPGDVVLDPFGGSGTTGQVAMELGRRAVLIELNPEYAKLINKRTDVTPGLAL